MKVGETNPDVEIEDVYSWADGVLGALGTEYWYKVTDEEAVVACAIVEAKNKLAK